jgi:hypothetical protein
MTTVRTTIGDWVGGALGAAGTIRSHDLGGLIDEYKIAA